MKEGKKRISLIWIILIIVIVFGIFITASSFFIMRTTEKIFNQVMPEINVDLSDPEGTIVNMANSMMYYDFSQKMNSFQRDIFDEKITEVITQFVQENNVITESQAYNYIAKGGLSSNITEEEKEHIFMLRKQSVSIPCTRIEKEAGLELPQIYVNTPKATNIESSFFVTNTGCVFIWPPYYNVDMDRFYVANGINVTTPSDYMSLSNIEISKENEAEMYKDGFKFVVDGVVIKVSNSQNDSINLLTLDTTADELANLCSIYYLDEINAESPEGLESKFIFDDRTTEFSTIIGLDKD